MRKDTAAARPQEAEIHVAGGGSDPHILALGQIVVQRKCRRTPFDLHRGERSLTGDLRSSPAMHTQERKLPPAGKVGELLADGGYSVGLVKAIGEESDAKWRHRQVAPKAKLAGNRFSTSAASLRFQALTGITGKPRSNLPRGS
jgi:hypothetical protein